MCAARAFGTGQARGESALDPRSMLPDLAGSSHVKAHPQDTGTPMLSPLKGVHWRVICVIGTLRDASKSVSYSGSETFSLGLKNSIFKIQINKPSPRRPGFESGLRNCPRW